MKIKTIILILMLILLVSSLVAPVLSAGNVLVLSYWFDSDGRTLEVIQGEQPQFGLIA